LTNGGKKFFGQNKLNLNELFLDTSKILQFAKLKVLRIRLFVWCNLIEAQDIGELEEVERERRLMQLEEDYGRNGVTYRC
jgi:hypothetical protein